jgi:cellulose synthase/poly-beta-1,6-N-acetylglucosamine synthase-like glycosyltransferase
MPRVRSTAPRKVDAPEANAEPALAAAPKRAPKPAPPRSHLAAALEMQAAGILVAEARITPEFLAAALNDQARLDQPLGEILIAKGVRAFDYYRAFAKGQGLRFVDLNKDPADPSLLSAHDRRDYAELSLIPWRRRDGIVFIAATIITERHHQWARRRFGETGYDFVATSPFDILWQAQSIFRDNDTREACEALFEAAPENSAKITTTQAQRRVAIALAIIYALCLILFPVATLAASMAAATLLYAATFLFKLLLTWVGASRRVDMDVSPEALAALKDADLPDYTVLVPMYREAKVLPLLARALGNLDYPQSKIEVMLVLEEDDTETIEAAKALNLPGTFTIIRTPPSHPKTKPKACNYALQYARGDLVTIYDAEDQPEPDQLKKAVLAFQRGDSRLACVQARLNYFNRGENWLTRMFTLEYSQWFDFLLPGLDWLKVPIPLGGTSNHFKLSALRKVGAWDPYNVTEDADLGVRFAQQGYTVGVINSTTFEEANGVLPSWIKQRSRWIKGYMQTWLVHMRRPRHLLRSIGWRGFLSFQLFVGCPPLIMLLNPVMWAVFILSAVLGGTELAWMFPEPIGSLAAFNLVFANAALVYFGVVAALKRRYLDLVVSGVLQPFYWILHSVAAYKALWQLIYNPHYWEKTEHGSSSVTQATLDAIAQAKP